MTELLNLTSLPISPIANQDEPNVPQGERTLVPDPQSEKTADQLKPKLRSRRNLIAILAPCTLLGLWACYQEFFPPVVLPICEECQSNSLLRGDLESLSPLWQTAPELADDLANELTLLESAHGILRLPKYRISVQEFACLRVLVERFDLRLNDYTRRVITDLVGFGNSEACSKLQELLNLSERLQTLMILTSKETPKCKELLDWHWLHYSCTSRQQ